MPTVVVVLLVLLGLGLLAQFVNVVQGDYGAVIPLVIGGLIMAGIAKGNKLAWQWGRIAGVLGGLLYLLGTIGVVFALVAVYDDPARFISQIDSPMDADTFKIVMWVAFAVVLLLLVTCWFIFFLAWDRLGEAVLSDQVPELRQQAGEGARFLFQTRQVQTMSGFVELELVWCRIVAFSRWSYTRIAST